jgi:hypothetical protein
MEDEKMRGNWNVRNRRRFSGSNVRQNSKLATGNRTQNTRNWVQATGRGISRSGFLRGAGVVGAGLGAAGLGLGNVAYATGGNEITVNNSYSPTEIQEAIYTYDVVKFAPGEYYPEGEGTLGELNVVNSTKLVALYPDNKPVLKACFNVDAPGDEVAFENLTILSTRPANWPFYDPDGLGVIQNQGSAELKVLGVDIEAGEFNVHGIFCRELHPDNPHITGNIFIEGCSIVCGPRWTVAVKNEELHDVNLFVRRNYVQGAFGIDNVPNGPSPAAYNGVMNIENNDIDVVGNYYSSPPADPPEYPLPGYPPTGYFSFGIWTSGLSAESNSIIKSNNINLGLSTPTDPYGIFSVGIVMGSRATIQNVVAKNNNIYGEAVFGFMLGGMEPFSPVAIYNCVIMGNNTSNLSIRNQPWYDNNNPGGPWKVYGSTYYLHPDSHDMIILGNAGDAEDDGQNNFITGTAPKGFQSLPSPPGDLVSLTQAAKQCVESGGYWDLDTMTCTY